MYSLDESAILQDRTFIEQMKADILRRAEENSDSEDSEDDSPGGGRTLAYEDELDDGPVGEDKVKVLGDGEESGDEVNEDNKLGESVASDKEGGQSKGSSSPDTILELAYIRDPKLFDRDAQTRRGRPRAELRDLTGTLPVRGAYMANKR